MTGANVGGWMVLEPWIAPSLFYRFLNKTQNETAADMYTFCEALGPVKGNQVLREHWRTFYNETWIQALKMRGIEILRLPIGDFTLDPYGPYIGCTDGAEDYIQWFYDICAKYDIKVLMDVHIMKDS